MKPYSLTRHRSLLPFLLALCLAAGAFFGVTATAGAAAPAGSAALRPETTPPPSGSVLPVDKGVAIAQIATVRLVTDYTFNYTTVSGTPVPTPPGSPTDGSCTGEGVVVSSPLPTASANNTLYVLTENSVIGPSPVCANDFPTKPTGFDRTATFKNAKVYLSTAYSGTGKAPVALQITQISANPSTFIPVPGSTLTLVAVPAPAGTRPMHDYPTVNLGSTASSTGQELLSLTNSSGAPLTNKDLNPQAQGTTADQFLTPQSTPFQNTAPENTPPGSPVIDGQTGNLINIIGGGGLPTEHMIAEADLSNLVPDFAQNCPSANATCLGNRWTAAIDTFYSTPSHTSAHDTLQKIGQDYPDFGGVTPFVAAATPQPAPRSTPGGQASPGATGIEGLWQSLNEPSKIGLIVLVALFLLVILMAALIYGRWASRRRRAQKQAAPAFSQRGKSGQLGPAMYAGPGGAAAATQYAGPTQGAPVQRTIVCPRCGTQNNAGSSNCANCGLELPQGVGGVSGGGSTSGGGRGLSRSTSGGGMRLSLPSNPPPMPMPDIAELPTMIQQPMNLGPDITEATLPNMAAISARSEDATLIMRGRKRPGLGVKVSTKSDLGERWRKRGGKENEDNFLAVTGTWKHNGQVQPFGLFVIADGMGGHANGQDASRMTVEAIYHNLAEQLPLQDVPDDQLTDLLKQAVQQANQTIYQQNQRDHADMGCTLTAALVTGNEAHICNVGDSRTYILTPESHLQRVTKDHSIVESLVDAGVIQRDDVYTHPKRNQIYRSLGEHEVAEIDTFRQALAAGDKLLLCCDGLWEMVHDPDIEHVMRQDDLPQVTSKLIEMANDAGGADNITAVVVKITEESKTVKGPMIESVATGPSSIMPPARR